MIIRVAWSGGIEKTKVAFGTHTITNYELRITNFLIAQIYMKKNFFQKFFKNISG